MSLYNRATEANAGQSRYGYTEKLSVQTQPFMAQRPISKSLLAVVPRWRKPRTRSNTEVLLSLFQHHILKQQLLGKAGAATLMESH